VSPYAQGTKVEVHKTQGEIRSLLTRHGATHFRLSDDPEGGMIAFTFRGKQYGFAVAHPIQDDPKAR
jgi:hypothetical protein